MCKFRFCLCVPSHLNPILVHNHPTGEIVPTDLTIETLADTADVTPTEIHTETVVTLTTHLRTWVAVVTTAERRGDMEEETITISIVVVVVVVAMAAASTTVVTGTTMMTTMGRAASTLNTAAGVPSPPETTISKLFCCGKVSYQLYSE